MVECQSSYIAQVLSKLILSGKRALSVKKPVFERFSAYVQEALSHTVWAASCSSWYVCNAAMQSGNATERTCISAWRGLHTGTRRHRARL